MRILLIGLLFGSFLLVGCGQDTAKSAPSSTPVPMDATTKAPAPPKKGVMQGARATFNGPGAKDADTRAGSKMTGH